MGESGGGKWVHAGAGSLKAGCGEGTATPASDAAAGGGGDAAAVAGEGCVINAARWDAVCQTAGWRKPGVQQAARRTTPRGYQT